MLSSRGVWHYSSHVKLEICIIQKCTGLFSFQLWLSLNCSFANAIYQIMATLAHIRETEWHNHISCDRLLCIAVFLEHHRTLSWIWSPLAEWISGPVMWMIGMKWKYNINAYDFLEREQNKEKCRDATINQTFIYFVVRGNA